jgi:hypothetical protein
VLGTPDYCIEVLRKIRAQLDADEFVGVFKYGGMPYEEAERNMRLFAKKVLPVIQADDAPSRAGLNDEQRATAK